MGLKSIDWCPFKKGIGRPREKKERSQVRREAEFGVIEQQGTPKIAGSH